MRGDGERASPKFNFTVYSNSAGQLKLVTNDFSTLERLLRGEGLQSEEGKRIILMDDSGVGFPIGGVLCGAYDAQTGQFYFREVEVEYFQGQDFSNRAYVVRFRERALEIIDAIEPNQEETVVKICTGFVNTKAKEALRSRKLLVVEVAEIGEPLQSRLEEEHRRYVSGLVGGAEIYYDPKALPKSQIPDRYHKAVDFARSHNLTHLLKTGWPSLQRVGLTS